MPTLLVNHEDFFIRQQPSRGRIEARQVSTHHERRAKDRPEGHRGYLLVLGKARVAFAAFVTANANPAQGQHVCVRPMVRSDIRGPNTAERERLLQLLPIVPEVVRNPPELRIAHDMLGMGDVGPVGREAQNHRPTALRNGRAQRLDFVSMVGMGGRRARGPAHVISFDVIHTPLDVKLGNRIGAYRVYQVRWPVLEGVSGEGLLLEPKRAPLGYVVTLPDADQTPEQIVGLAAGIGREEQIARRLAENGFEVVVPVLIDRGSRWSGDPQIRITDQTHREWIYRQAFHMGRHVIGYEVEKVLAAVDWFQRKSGGKGQIGVTGYGEGGLIAFYSAAVDTRIDAALVSGYFDSRQAVWSEPIYRNVWGLLREFGDAELATLIAPRGLIVEYSQVPAVTNQKGDLKTSKFEAVRAEFDRIDALTRPGFQPSNY